MIPVFESQLPPVKPPARARIGLYVIGHPHYWNQFSGLRERLLGYTTFLGDECAAWGEIHNFGMVDNAADARRAGEWFNAKNVDLLFCFAGTYACSASNIAIPRICKRRVVLLNLQPAPRMNYDLTTTGEWLAHCNACCVPEMCNAFERTGIDYELVSGLLGLRATPDISVTDEVSADHPDAVSAWQEIREWCQAATVQRTLANGRMGFLGHTYPGMLDMYSDFTMVQGQTGLHVEVLEMCDLFKLERDVTADQIEAKRAEVTGMFDLSEDSPSDPLARKPTAEQLEAACRTAVAMERLVREFDLDALTYYYRGIEGHDYQRLQESFILGNSLLTGRGIPCSGEGDMKTAIAMKISDICGVGGSFCEIVATDFIDRTIIMGHDGPFHIGIAAKKPILRGMGLYHGKWGSGVSVEAKVRTGPVTCMGVTQTRDGRLKMIVNQGESTDGPVLRIGNTMTPVRFAMGPVEFMNSWFREGPTHHFAMSIGHNSGVFTKVARLLDWPVTAISL